MRLTHKNVIANILQFNIFESGYKDKEPEMVLGVLPQSHAFALIGTSHMSIHRGDGVVVLQRFDIHDTLRAIEEFRIGRLWMVS